MAQRKVGTVVHKELVSQTLMRFRLQPEPDGRFPDYQAGQHIRLRLDDCKLTRKKGVAPDGKPIVTFEGIRISPDYSFENAPPVDILIIPSTETSMTADLKNTIYMNWVQKTAKSASHVITVCDGAFPLAATGALKGRVVTTFPADRDRLAEMFPEVTVKYDVNFVVDGKYITSVGGALSYEPAFYLVEKLYSTKNAKRIAKGLVWDWELTKVPHLIVTKKTATH
ncbi:DJ-1/PfpI family protein [candidate division KSB1 bacterium]|nr:DJ-1/PfpI family protein [candidate division KSB1 bacterium]